MIVAPIVFCVVVHGIAGAGDLKKVGRVGVKALVYFEVMTTVALVLGIILAFAFAFGSGHGMNINPASLDPKAMATAADNAHKLQGGGIGSFLVNIIPTTSIVHWRGTTCCRCCSSRCCSASRWRWLAARRASVSPS
jgi:aerobic C4-dicarboxylate transport protein